MLDYSFLVDDSKVLLSPYFSFSTRHPLYHGACYGYFKISDESTKSSTHQIWADYTHCCYNHRNLVWTLKKQTLVQVCYQVDTSNTIYWISTMREHHWEAQQ